MLIIALSIALSLSLTHHTHTNTHTPTWELMVIVGLIKDILVIDEAVAHNIKKMGIRWTFIDPDTHTHTHTHVEVYRHTHR